MKKTIVSLAILSIIILLIWFLPSSSKPRENHSFNFYHWKLNAKNSPEISSALKKCKTEKIYLHFFDVVYKYQPENWSNQLKNFKPNYVIRDVDESYKKFTIIPVVYITNEVLKKVYKDNVIGLANKLTKLIDQIAKHHQIDVSTVQLDCDWSTTTKEQFFTLIEEVKKSYKVDVTLRLHQIKYPDKTGVPPADSGTLMLYNVTKITDMKQNSILNIDTVKQYVNSSTNYKMPLKIALPIYSQTVIEYAPGSVNISHNFPPETLNMKEISKLSENLFKVSDTIFHEQMILFKDSLIERETITPDLVAECYKEICKSELKFDEIILYHLDEKSLKNFSIEELEEQL